MNKAILLSFFTFLLLINIVSASTLVSCSISPSTVDLETSDQVTTTIILNNAENVAKTETVKIGFPSTYFSSTADTQNITIDPNSSKTITFTLKALTATTSDQSITVIQPSALTCSPQVKILVASDTTVPTVGVITSATVIPNKAVTFTASVSDNVGIKNCNLYSNGVLYAASVSGDMASYTFSSGLSEGTYQMRFECYDNAGNKGSGSDTTIKVEKGQLSTVLTIPKDNYYPAENLETRVKVTDQDGKIITDATVKGMLGTTSLYFFYSTLCDCYKSMYWISESMLPNTYTLNINVTHQNYKIASISKTITLLKPSLKMTMSTDKSEYNAGESVQLTIKTTDSLGNSISDAYITGEIRDATTGGLISTIYPWIKESVYYYSYYVGSESVGKSYKISVSAKWKEQNSSSSVMFSVVKRGVNGDVVLEKNVFIPGDILQGKVKVYDKSGNTVSDANININIKDSQGKQYRYLSAKYIEGYYEIEQWKVEDWISVGTYIMEIEIKWKEERVVLTKSIEITKESLKTDVIFGQTSYSPGGRIYLKILVTYPNGVPVKDASIGGEIFPLTQEIEKIEAIGGSPKSCRIYIAPQGPIYYQGEFIQKYYIDDVWIPDYCPTGKYVITLSISKSGYADTKITKEFDVARGKLLIETGFKIESKPDAVNLYVYAELKDDNGNVVPYADIKGYLHPAEKEGCVKRVGLGYDDFIKRYATNVFLPSYECPAGKYLLEITASKPYYETAEVVQAVEVNFSEGYKYSVVVPSSVSPVECKEVPCPGVENCFQKVCTPTTLPQECSETVTDKQCVEDCKKKIEKVEEVAIKTETLAVTIDLKKCIEDNCVKKIECRGSTVQPTQSDEMMKKLEEIHTEIKETKKEVNIVQGMVQSIIDFINFIISRFMTQPTQPIIANTTAPSR